MTIDKTNNIALIVPTLNAGVKWGSFLEILADQTISFKEVAIIDSGSRDKTVPLAKQYNLNVFNINKSEFNHGRTRQNALDNLAEIDIVVFMTQDAILHDNDSIANLISIFNDKSVAAAYGRQLPHPDAKPLGTFAREVNYPDQSYIYSKTDIPTYGIKTAFLSNSFAAYRKQALEDVGGFPRDVIFGEDMYVAAKMLLHDWKVAYVSDACVYHSHDYTAIEDFRRYFDMGVFHNRETWLLDELGKPEGEGASYIVAEFKYLLRKAPYLIPYALIKTIFKYAGYKLGKIEHLLPNVMKKRFSMNKSYWR